MTPTTSLTLPSIAPPSARGLGLARAACAVFAAATLLAPCIGAPNTEIGMYGFVAASFMLAERLRAGGELTALPPLGRRLDVRLSSGPPKLPHVVILIGVVITSLFVTATLSILGAELAAVLDGRHAQLAFVSMAVATLAAAVFFYVALLRSLRAPILSVGSDGVAVGKKFIRYDDTTAVSMNQPGSVTLALQGGDATTLPCWGSAREALFGRIRDAREAFGEATASDDAKIAALDRGDRSLASWRDHLKKIASGGDAYRGLHLGAEVLGAVIEDPRAGRERRLGAAIALSSIAPEAAQGHVARVLEASADASLRLSLVRACRGMNVGADG